MKALECKAIQSVIIILDIFKLKECMMQKLKHTLSLAGFTFLATLSGCATHVNPEPVHPAKVDTSGAGLVHALNGTFGVHEHMRASHAKGFCAAGEFVPTPHAAELSASPMFKQATLPANIRFSIGGGNPKASDKSRSIRGMSASIRSGDQRYDLVLISEPVFFASTLASFVGFLEARVADPATKKPDPEKVKAHNHHYPEAKLQGALVGSHPAPASYVTTPYYSTNAFKFTNEAHHSQFARIVVEPVKGKYYLTEEQEHSFADSFLEDELKARLDKAPAEFTVFAQLPGQGDSVVNPATIWPEDRPRIELGKLIVKNNAAQACDNEVYVPTNLPKGIEPSDDPILKARAEAYAVSKAKRSH